jgi:hypothetical protein
METTTTLKGSYTPKDYLDNPVHISTQNLTLDISNGQIDASLKYYTDTPRAEMWEIEMVISRKINNLFRFVRITKRKPFSFNIYTVQMRLADGTIYRIIKSEPTNAILTTTPAAPITPEEATKRAQAEQERVTQAIKYTKNDVTLEFMINSYIAAADDPENELIHLYDVMDALREKFEVQSRNPITSRHDTNNTVINKLQITGKRDQTWNRLENLAFEKQQGRHKGRHHTNPQNATSEELDEARVITRFLISKYIDYLEREQQHSTN